MVQRLIGPIDEYEVGLTRRGGGAKLFRCTFGWDLDLAMADLGPNTTLEPASAQAWLMISEVLGHG